MEEGKGGCGASKVIDGWMNERSLDGHGRVLAIRALFDRSKLPHITRATATSSQILPISGVIQLLPVRSPPKKLSKNYQKTIKKQKNKKTPRRGYDGASTALGLTHHFAPLEHKRRVDDRQRRLPTLSRVLSSSLVALYNPRAFTRTTRALQKTEAMTSQHSSRKFSAYQVFRSTEVSTHTCTYREEAKKR